MKSFDTDVFVLGGGPAGLAAAIAARQAGLNVILADARRPPIDKACGEGLMPDAVSAASQLGINIPRAEGHVIRGIRYRSSQHQVMADFPAGPGMALRRTVLQPLLVTRAEQAGVETLWGRSVTGLAGNSILLGNEKLQARWVVGADGMQSSTRRWGGMQSFRRNSHRFSYRRHFQIAPFSDYVEVFWGDGFQLYLTPVSNDEIGLALITRNPRQRIENALQSFPFLNSLLSGRPATSTERGALAATRQLHRVTKGNIALIGDAAGTVDPISGEGLCLAFKEGLILASALAAGDLHQYERAHRRLTRRPRFMADFMLLMDRSAFIRRRTLAAFESHPPLFANLLSMHVGDWSPARFAATATMLGWQLISS